MKCMGLFVFALFSATSFAIAPFSDGSYEGKGYWKDVKGGKGTYTASITINGAEFTSKLVLDSGEVIEEAGEVKMEDTGFYTIVDKRTGLPTAKGYCGSVWCHTVGKTQDGVFEETMAQKGDQIFRLGSSKMVKVGHFMWEDALNKVR